MQPQHQGNVTTCHIGINAKPFHEPPPHTWALTHYICLALLMQVASSGSLKFHTPLRHQYKQLLMSRFLSYKKSRGLWEQPTALGSTLRRFIWLLIRTIPSYLRDCNLFCHHIDTQHHSVAFIIHPHALIGYHDWSCEMMDTIVYNTSSWHARTLTFCSF